MENEKDKLWELMGKANKLEPSPWFVDEILRRVEKMEQVREEYISVPRFFWKFAAAFGVFAIAGTIFLVTPPDHLPVTPTPVLAQAALPVAPNAVTTAPLSQPLIETSYETEPVTDLITHEAVVTLPDTTEMAANPAIQPAPAKVHHLDLIQTGFETASGLGTQGFSY